MLIKNIIEYYKNFKNLIEAFKTFIEKTPPIGKCFLFLDDPKY